VPADNTAANAEAMTEIILIRNTLRITTTLLLKNVFISFIV
jgi:hypothetical protein